jgi:hypothetical protein
MQNRITGRVGGVGGVGAVGGAVAKALDFAVKAHGNQKYGTEPYAVHLREVMTSATRLGFSDDKFQIAAALHDVIEDTNVDKAGIGRAFGKETAEVVQQLSHDHNVDAKDYLAAMGDTAFCVKLADRLANVERMGTLENTDIRAAFLLAKYLPDMPLFAAEAKVRGFDKAFAVLDAAMTKTAAAIQGSVSPQLLDFAKDEMARKAAEVHGAGDGTNAGGAFVASMGGKKPSSLSSSPMFAVRAPKTEKLGVGP